ncbi:hypothetical protein ACQ86N_37515 [Puia sp. P3]|uniref:hypothetical protein n=1 Tax=Puia sp. P3 TaxID=3423952 RepID=UPI003D66D9BC
MKTRLNVVLVTTATAAVLLAGCVSSKKYKASQAALQQSKGDSARLAQQVTSLNGNVHDLEEKNSSLQRSLDSSTNNYATQQKSLGYYQNYFSQQQAAMSQVSNDLKGAMSQAGLANEDVQQVDNTIYVRLDEDKVFKKNSTTVTTSGKQALNNLAQVIKNRSNNVNVFVNDGDSSSGQPGAAMSSSSSGNEAMTSNAEDNTTARTTPKHHSSHHAAAARKSSSSGASGSGASASPSGASSGTVASAAPKSSTATTHHRVHHRAASSEGSTTIYNNMPRTSRSKAWALKQARMNMVAGNFLQSGVPKVNIALKQPAGNGNPSNNNINVVLTPVMNDFNPGK